MWLVEPTKAGTSTKRAILVTQRVAKECDVPMPYSAASIGFYLAVQKRMLWGALLGEECKPVEERLLILRDDSETVYLHRPGVLPFCWKSCRGYSSPGESTDNFSWLLDVMNRTLKCVCLRGFVLWNSIGAKAYKPPGKLSSCRPTCLLYTIGKMLERVIYNALGRKKHFVQVNSMGSVKPD